MHRVVVVKDLAGQTAAVAENVIYVADTGDKDENRLIARLALAQIQANDHGNEMLYFELTAR